jgi:hypothetical protein
MYDDMPTERTIYYWKYKHEDFFQQYARARAAQIDILADKLNDIADDGTNDYMQSLDDESATGYKLNGEHISRSRLRIDTIKWQASKLLRKQYGDVLIEDTKAENEELRKEIDELKLQLNKKYESEY